MQQSLREFQETNGNKIKQTFDLQMFNHVYIDEIWWDFSIWVLKVTWLLSQLYLAWQVTENQMFHHQAPPTPQISFVLSGGWTAQGCGKARMLIQSRCGLWIVLPFPASEPWQIVGPFSKFVRQVCSIMLVFQWSAFLRNTRNTISFLRNKNMPNAAAWISSVTSSFGEN